MSDGGGILILEELESALKRINKPNNIYCEITGYDLNCDAYHILRPEETGLGLYKAITNSLKEAKLSADNVDLFDAHATSTPLGDQAEASCIKRILTENF